MDSRITPESIAIKEEPSDHDHFPEESSGHQDPNSKVESKDPKVEKCCPEASSPPRRVVRKDAEVPKRNDVPSTSGERSSSNKAASRMKMYTIVEFVDGLHLVPTIWLTKNKSMCFWPRYQNQINMKKAVADRELPVGNQWDEYPVIRIFGDTDSYEWGLEQVRISEQTSDVEDCSMSDKISRAKKTRRLRAKKRVSSSEEESAEENELRHKLPASSSSSGVNIRKNGSKKVPHSSKTAVHISEARKTVSDAKMHAERAEALNVSGANHISTKGKALMRKNSFVRSVLFNSTEVSISAAKPSESYNAFTCDEDYEDITVSVQPNFSGCAEDNTSPEYPEWDLAAEESLLTNEFRREVLEKLNLLLYKTDRIEERLSCLEATRYHKDEESDVSYQDIGLPLQNLKELNDFEKILTDSTFFKKLINMLRTIGGSDVHAIVYGILKKLVSNSLALEFSWAGFKGKRSFKDLLMTGVISKTVRLHRPCATDVEIIEAVSKWLAQAKLRREREARKEEKKQEIARSEAMDNV